MNNGRKQAAIEFFNIILFSLCHFVSTSFVLPIIFLDKLHICDIFFVFFNK
jgi:hypothetical protein